MVNGENGGTLKYHFSDGRYLVLTWDESVTYPTTELEYEESVVLILFI